MHSITASTDSFQGGGCDRVEKRMRVTPREQYVYASEIRFAPLGNECGSWKQARDHPPRAERIRPPQMVVNDLLRIKPHAMEHRGVDVDGIDRVGGGISSDAVGGAVDAAAANAATGQ